MIAIGLVVWHLFDGILEQGRGNRKGPVFVIGPAKSVSGIGKIWQTFPCGLRQRQSHVDVSAMFKEEVGKVVCSMWFVGFERENLLVSNLCFLPISLPFIQGSKKQIELRIVLREFKSTTIGGNRLIEFAVVGLGLSKQPKDERVFLVQSQLHAGAPFPLPQSDWP